MTRLRPSTFKFLQDWCIRNEATIERQRMLERQESESTIRKLAEDLRDIELVIHESYKALARNKKKKRQIKRKLLVLSDETQVVTNEPGLLKKKLYIFCNVLSQPLFEFDYTKYPMIDGSTLSERDVVM